MIEVSGLTKRYGAKTAVRNLEFKAGKGEVLGFLGPNGAGKSTTMNMLTGYQPASEGRVVIAGHDLSRDPLPAKRSIGYLPEIPPLYPELKVQSYLNFVAALKGVRREKRAAHLCEIMELVKLTEVRGRLIKNLSKGFKQRVGLAQALVGNPPILILDQPTVGLDPKQIMEIRSLIKRLGKEHTIILSSHILAEISMTCDRVIIINQGEIAASDTPQNLAQNLRAAARFLVRVHGPADQVRPIIEAIEGVIRMEEAAPGRGGAGFCEWTVEHEKGRDVKTPLFFALAERGYAIHEMRDLEISLEDIFLQLTPEEGLPGQAEAQ